MPTLRLAVALNMVAVTLCVCSAAAAPQLEAVLARYEVRQAPHAIEHLELVRTDSRIEYRLVDRGVIEIWQRDGRGELEHWKVFPRDRRSVHYTAGDLRTLHNWPSWDELGGLVGGDVRKSLVPSGKKQRLFDAPAVELRGSREAKVQRVVWLDSLSLPASVERGRAKLRLVDLQRCGATCPLTSLDGIAEMEFADVGDAERDPFVRRFLAYVGQHHSH